MRTYRLAGIALLAVLAAACPEDPPAPPVGDLGLTQEGRLTICSDLPYAPFEFEDPSAPSGYAGFDIEIMEAIAAALDLEIAVVVTPFSAIDSGSALEAGTCDVLASAVTITEERQQSIAFTESYLVVDQSLLVRTDDADTYDSLEALAGESIGVQTDTTGAAYAEEHLPTGAEITEYPDAGAMFLALTASAVEALLQDFPVNQYRALQDGTFVVTDQFPTEEPYGFGVSLDNDALLDAIDNALADLRDDGTYDSIYATYFGEASG